MERTHWSWLTSSSTPGGNGLEGSHVDKTRYRLSVDIPADAPLLHPWLEWAARNVTPDTIAALATSAAKHPGAGPQTWFVYLGVIPASAIVACHDMQTGEAVPEWGEVSPAGLDMKAVPPWRRQAWQKRMLKVAETAAKRSK